MLTTSTWGQQSNLAQPLPPSELEIRLPVGDLVRFTPANGQWYYLTLRRGFRREVVQVHGVVGGLLQVTRAQDGTVAQQWAAGDCVEVEWNPQQLREFIEQVGAGVEPTGVSPGTYCLDCNACITVNAAGQITQVDGAGGCA